MPDPVPVSREEIERHIREKGVTKVARGVSGLVDEHGNWIGGSFYARRNGRPKKAPPPAPKPEPAPERVHASRAHAEQFAAAIEGTRKTAPEKPRTARVAASPGPAPETPKEPKGKGDDALRARYRAMHAEGLTAKQMAERLGVTKWAAYGMLRQMGLDVPNARRGPAADEATRQRYRALHAEGKTVREIAEALGVNMPAARKMLAKIGLTPNPSPRQTPKSRMNAERQAKFRELISAGKSVKEISEAMEVSASRVYQIATRLGLTVARASAKRPGRNGAADVKKAERAERHAGIVADRRRFRTVSVPMGEPAVLLPTDHEAVTEARSYFPSRVMDPSAGERVLIDGCNNAKIGGDVLVGWLKGARIYTLTLEERATCPKDCPIWRGCYGNSMHYARRWRHGPALERRIASEIRQLCHQHERVLVRLHVLGDFYSADYVQFWQGLLIEHQGLHVFGFTAWGDDSEIGSYVAAVRAAFPRRWWVRHSGRTGPWGSFTVDFPTAKKRIGDALVCPEQREAMNGNPEGRHCGNCAACWSCESPIAFIEH